MDYKHTLNLPRTDFPMKADLVTREPERLNQWASNRLYDRIQAQRAGAEKFVLHDGPPFANGDVHIGTALNKILKDIIVKYKNLRGFCAPYVPGWDCHGLPIEFKVTQEMRQAGAAASAPTAIRKACLKKLITIRLQCLSVFKAIGYLQNTPRVFDAARENLIPNPPRPFITVALDMFEGMLAFYDQDLEQIAAQRDLACVA